VHWHDGAHKFISYHCANLPDEVAIALLLAVVVVSVTVRSGAVLLDCDSLRFLLLETPAEVVLFNDSVDCTALAATTTDDTTGCAATAACGGSVSVSTTSLVPMPVTSQQHQGVALSAALFKHTETVLASDISLHSATKGGVRRQFVDYIQVTGYTELLLRRDRFLPDAAAS
jgi:hypothetical protein